MKFKGELEFELYLLYLCIRDDVFFFGRNLVIEGIMYYVVIYMYIRILCETGVLRVMEVYVGYLK